MISNTQPGPDLKPLTDEEIERLRSASYLSVLSNHKRTVMQEMIRMSIVLLLSCILFFAHWRLMRKY